MKVFIAVLLGSFFVGGTRVGRHLLDRPVRLAVVCLVVAAAFYSARVVT